MDGEVEDSGGTLNINNKRKCNESANSSREKMKKVETAQDIRVEKQKREANRYGIYDRGPYFVYFEKNNIRPDEVGKILTKNNLTKFVGREAIGRNKLKIECKDGSTANKIMDLYKIFNEHGIEVYIPFFCIETAGVIRNISNDISMEELVDNLMDCPKIVKAERINRWDNIEKVAIPTDSVKIIFRSSTLPEKVVLFNFPVRVNYYYQKPCICKKCFRYGHIAKICRSKEQICENCTQVHSEGESCNNETICRYCKENHKTTDPKCPQRKVERQVMIVMAKKKLGYVQAKREVIGSVNYNSSRQSKLNNRLNYAEVVKNQEVEIKKQKEMTEELEKVKKELEDIKMALRSIADKTTRLEDQTDIEEFILAIQAIARPKN